ncbi:DNA endonuclease SmrA [Hahella aquimaris]|uniref:DNA endonuclease SmrA n=1 Tax=Hahella sp. HNIBRBA332 TaxID=3015983 RepID=UPI00273C204A|nr:DNA endonuclease SmrA [Hahella sp. HNIBRBA332]WLQ14833.1 DNA endonuclease SmrA [Hahella sp. HNIBRBA332]
MQEDKDDLFAEEMSGVKPLPRHNKADVKKTKEDTPGQEIRRKAAVRHKLLDLNFLSGDDHVEILKSNDLLEYKKDGVQHGVYKKLRLGQYQIEARLDLHRKTVEEARVEVFQFVRDCLRYDLRTVIILHGKGDRNQNQEAIIKSYVNRWLREFDEVLAFHSAQKQHGGSGAVYVLLRKSDREKQNNRERFGSR